MMKESCEIATIILGEEAKHRRVSESENLYLNQRPKIPRGIASIDSY